MEKQSTLTNRQENISNINLEFDRLMADGE